MTDLEIVRKCAERMRYSDVQRKGDHVHDKNGNIIPGIYWPLEDDAQAMALVKKVGISIGRSFSGEWFCQDFDKGIISESKDLNRAICECVAKLPDTET